MSRKKISEFKPLQVFLDAFPSISGNAVNGLGEEKRRPPSPFFWHPPAKQTHGELQTKVTKYHRQSAEIRKHFLPEPPGGRGPKAVKQTTATIQKPAEDWVVGYCQRKLKLVKLVFKTNYLMP